MSQSLKLWLRQEAAALCTAVFENTPPALSLNHDDVSQFLATMADNVGLHSEFQLASVQGWALTAIGQDGPRSRDWLWAIRLLKDALFKALTANMSPVEALKSWRALDEFLTFAMIEASQLATDFERANLLDQIVQLRKQQEIFERSKSNFINVAAHELRTPLTILEGYANMIRAEAEAGSRFHIYTEGLGNGFRRMHEIIGDMIDASLIDLGSVELKIRQISLESTIKLVTGKLQKLFAERNVELIVAPFYVESDTFGDEERLAKAFTKVIMNGLKYTPDNGQVNITAAFIRQDEADENLAGYIDIQISDSGIGISPENHDLIFNKFASTSAYQLHSSSKTNFKGGGAGLGLAIVKGIIEAHKGRIWAESPGYDEEKLPGTTFHIELPIWVNEPN
ncbi:MAG: HAMP domain-containing sensor histidine kinase [Chloroflexota bacterium]